MNLRERTIKGLTWTSIEKWGSQALNFVIFTILARLLSPDDFGLVASAAVFTSFVQIFMDQGMGQAIVQRVDLTREHLDTAFWVQVLTGGLMTLVGVAVSGVVAGLFDEPRLQPVVAWLSLGFIITAFRSTQQAILRRELDFEGLAVRTLVARLCGGIVGVGTALLGFGVWSLVIQNLVIGLTGVVVLWRVSDWRPSFHFSRQHFRELFSFGLNIVGLRIMNYLDTSLADFLIGTFLGTTALGFYSVAQRLRRIMVDLLTGILTSVAYPAFARMQDRPSRLRRAFYQATQLTSLFTFPAFLGMVVLAPELIPVLFGEKWLPVVPVMQILAFGGLYLSLSRLNDNLLKAVGKPSWVLGLSVLSSLVNVVGFLLAVHYGYGLVMVAVVFSFVRYLFTPLYIWMLHRTIHLDMKGYFRQYIVPLVASLAMIIVVLVLKYFLSGQLGLLVSLIVYGVAGAAVYVVAAQLMNPALLKSLRNLALLALPWRLSKQEEAANNKTQA